jgi:hypothetical protein
MDGYAVIQAQPALNEPVPPPCANVRSGGGGIIVDDGPLEEKIILGWTKRGVYF